ncbi:hypothetical protein BDF22DRAFT_745039 [Syncephalis plumigaleata]|nr:hypothetical protein BDF22DRAFT_745039 [Syncephalis plumigaleata]
MEFHTLADNHSTSIDSVSFPLAHKMPPRLNSIGRSYSDPMDMVQSLNHSVDPTVWSPTTATPPLTPCTMKDDDDETTAQHHHQHQMLDESSPSAPIPCGDRKRKLSISSHEQPSIEAKHHIVHFNEQHWFRDANDYLMKSRRRSGMPNIFDIQQPITLDADPMANTTNTSSPHH